ncbi:Pr6Pr family membrane protein [Microbacterium sp. YY-03]|uniref:Pr6Pr family membrane protein n=1 Tax=Microbacterium sp. YY-03 TaxID=3421636 RepID=UPI003D17F5A4
MSDSHAVHPGTNVRVIWAIVRLATSALMAAAVVAQFVTTFTLTAEKGRDVETTLVNFFSFFTILSSCLGVIVMLVGGLWLLTRGAKKQWEPRWMSYVWISVGTYMVITGIVYNLLLRGYVLEQGATVVWANEVLHLIGPIMFLLDLVLCIARRPLGWTAMGVAVIFPIAWVIYTLVRGENVTSPVTGDPYWYPYPFLNPYLQPNGYFGVGIYVIGIAAAILMIAALAVWRTRVGRRADTTEEEPTDDVAVETESQTEAEAAPAAASPKPVKKR